MPRWQRRSQLRLVLIVDDDITQQELLASIVEHLGYVPVKSVDGMDGLAAAREQRFDLIIVDMKMPRMSGTQLVTTLRRHRWYGETPTFLRSAEDMESKILEVGATEFLSKSDSQETLMAAIREHLN